MYDEQKWRLLMISLGDLRKEGSIMSRKNMGRYGLEPHYMRPNLIT